MKDTMTMISGPRKRMSTDTQDFLGTLLWLAYSPDDPTTDHIKNWTIWEFHPDFVNAVDAFIQGFYSYLESEDFDIGSMLDVLERPFGGNVYLSLTGHGAGFYDESDSELGNAIQDHLTEYSDDQYRFEELEHNLCKFNGKIHLHARTEAFRKKWLEDLFMIPNKED